MRYGLVLLCFLLSFAAMGQPNQQQQQQQVSSTREELLRRRESIMSAIKESQEQLEATKKNKNATMGELHALQNKLAERQSLISNINEEINDISSNIQLSGKEVEQLRQKLDLLKVRYAQSIRYAYTNRNSFNMLAFMFSSKDFNEAIRRMRYLKKYRDYRKQQVEQIRITRGQIETKIVALNKQKNQKDELLSTQQQQEKVLEEEKNEKNKVVTSLKGKEKELMAEIEKSRKATKKLDNAINDIIRREIELEKKRAQEEDRKRREREDKNKNAQVAHTNTANNNNNNNNSNDPYSAKSFSANGTPITNTNKGTNVVTNNKNVTTNNNKIVSTTNTKTGNNNPTVAANTNKQTTTAPKEREYDASYYNLSLTPEAAALSNNLEANRGRLPWPVEKGFVSGQFGKHPHPVAEKVMIENNGIDIRTSPNAIARVVFDGRVSTAALINGQWTIIVTHGRYYTVYSGLSKKNVDKGDEVHTKQTIGTVGTNDDGDPTINFQIWKDVGKKDAIKLDPASWIAK
ncbi:MAG: peptidoglycan DD-metalloendopeptidase family protein [Bacteroidota bacterium]